MNALKEDCLHLHDELVSLRREFHRDPELGLHEYHTAARIERELDRCAIPHERIGETAVVARLRGTGAGTGVCVLRADIDALPIRETNDVPYRSETPGVMHACGHDAHTTCLIGAAKVLSAHRADFGGEVRFLFQPAEEIGDGARPLIAAHVLDGADRVFGLHTASDLPSGTVGLRPGCNNAAVDHFTVRIHGKSTHVSTPQLGADALYIASELVVALQAIVTRTTSPIDPVLIGVGKLSAGTAYNAVAEFAELEGTTRTLLPETRTHVHAAIDAAAEHISALYGGTVQIEWEDFAPPLLNDASVCEEASRVAAALGIPTTKERALSLSGDNFADYLLFVKGAYAYLGTANSDKPHTCISNHHGDFDIDEAALPLGAALYAAYAVEVCRRETGQVAF